MEIATRRCPRVRVVWDLRELTHEQKPRLWSLGAKLGPVTVHPTRSDPTMDPKAMYFPTFFTMFHAVLSSDCLVPPSCNTRLVRSLLHHRPAHNREPQNNPNMQHEIPGRIRNSGARGCPGVSTVGHELSPIRNLYPGPASPTGEQKHPTLSPSSWSRQNVSAVLKGLTLMGPTVPYKATKCCLVCNLSTKSVQPYKYYYTARVACILSRCGSDAFPTPVLTAQL